MANIKKLLQKAIKCHQAGDLVTAVATYQRILKVNPGNVDALYLLGTLNLQQGDLASAHTLLKKATTLKPDHVEAQNNLGTVLKEQGGLEDAVESYRQAVRFKPGYAMAHNNLATVLHELGRLDEAVISCSEAIEIRPDYAEAYYNIGTILREQGKLEESVERFRQAIKFKSNFALAHNNLGVTLKEQGKFEEAIENYRQAIGIKPDYADAYSNLGNIFKEQEKHDDAIASYDKAIRFKPDHAEAFNNLGTVFLRLGKIDEAVASCKRAIELKPDSVDAHFNLSLVLLLREDFEDGWKEYEWRLRMRGSSLYNFQQPRWNGSQLKGLSILVHAEQGLGDTIQFVRYLPLVRERGGYVIFECHNDLLHLLKNCEGIDKIIKQTTTSEPIEHFDVQVPLLSLPGIFGTTLDNLPPKTPYITIDSGLVEQWRLQIDNNDDFKVGIVWAGSPTFKNDRNRSCSLTDFSSLAEIPDITFYSLQKGLASKDVLKPPEGMKITDLGKDINDFADTAAIIANLDLVISVDTAVVHLAGATGKPVWALLPFASDWRWLLRREDSPWYTSMRLFRQGRPKDWAGVFEHVKMALLDKLAIVIRERIVKE